MGRAKNHWRDLARGVQHLDGTAQQIVENRIAARGAYGPTHVNFTHQPARNLCATRVNSYRTPLPGSRSQAEAVYLSALRGQMYRGGTPTGGGLIGGGTSFDRRGPKLDPLRPHPPSLAPPPPLNHPPLRLPRRA